MNLSVSRGAAPRLLALLCAVLLWPGAAAASDLYTLGTGDVIRIQVFGEDDLTLEVRLGDQGVVNYPFLGEIQVAGSTPSELESTLVNGLKPDYLVNPNVNVSVVEYRPFYIVGEVEKPGGYPFQPGLTVQQAIALGGGMTERASRQKIFVTREADPQRRLIPTNLIQTLRPGDTVTVEQSFF